MVGPEGALVHPAAWGPAHLTPHGSWWPPHGTALRVTIFWGPETEQEALNASPRLGGWWALEGLTHSTEFPSKVSPVPEPTSPQGPGTAGSPAQHRGQKALNQRVPLAQIWLETTCEPSGGGAPGVWGQGPSGPSDPAAKATQRTWLSVAKPHSWSCSLQGRAPQRLDPWSRVDLGANGGFDGCRGQTVPSPHRGEGERAWQQSLAAHRLRQSA